MNISKILSLILVGFFCLGASSCSVKKDLWQCILIQVDGQGKMRPLDQWYWYCTNPALDKNKSIPIENTGACIRSGGNCKWYGTDLNEYERGRKIYKDECQK